MSGVTIDSYSNVTKGSTSALVTALEAGPVAVGISAKELRHYSSGVIKKCDDDANHFALLVGHGTTTEGNDYWLVQNSWGSAWGESGYAKISKQAIEPEEIDSDGDGVTDEVKTKSGTCGILIHAA